MKCGTAGSGHGTTCIVEREREGHPSHRGLHRDEAGRTWAVRCLDHRLLHSCSNPHGHYGRHNCLCGATWEKGHKLVGHEGQVDTLCPKATQYSKGYRDASYDDIGKD